MNKISLLLALLFTLQLFTHQDELAAQVDSTYLNDAKLLALREIYTDTLGPYADSVEIPVELINKYYDALIAIQLLDNEAVDTVFDIYTIHAFPNIPFQQISMIGDTNYSWVKTFLENGEVSGNDSFDNVINSYGFELKSSQQMNSGTFITLETSRYLHLTPIVDSLKTVEGLSNVDATDSAAGDGNNIECTESNDTIYVNFSLGWGDCYSGCIHRRYWEFLGA